MGNCVGSICISETGFCFELLSNAMFWSSSPSPVDHETTTTTTSSDSDLKTPHESPPPPPLPVPINKPPEPVKIEKTKPPEPPANPKNPHHQNRGTALPIIAGLQADSVLQRKTGNLKEFYKLGRKLGQGEYGTTFLCVEKETGKEYACKSIAKTKLKTEDAAEDVRREIQIMQHLAAAGNHPNVISIKGAYEDTAAVHVVMELCKGGELFDRIARKGRFTEKKAVELARTIVGVVEACHSLGVMHRDLKPENFMFVDNKEDSALKTIDFGLSVFFKPGETFDESVGSPYYVAPEVLGGKRYGPEADVWSAGVIIYILLSGVPPFFDKTDRGTLKKVLHGEVDFVSGPWPSVSENAKDLVKKMLVRDPKRRLTAQQALCHPWVVDQVEGVAHDQPS